MGRTGSQRAGRVTLVLLILNLLVLAAGVGVQYALSNRYPDLPELNAGKIRLWSQPTAYKAAEPVLPPTVAVAEATKPAPVERLCLELTDLSQTHYLEMQKIIQTAGLTTGQCQYSFGKKLGWWVFWPPEYEAVQREKVLQAIRSAGVQDVLPVTQGVMAQAFSLGVFTSEGQARQHRDGLRRKGLDKAEYGPRPSMGGGKLSCAPGSAGELQQVKASLPAWATQLEPDQCTGTTP